MLGDVTSVARAPGYDFGRDRHAPISRPTRPRSRRVDLCYWYIDSILDVFHIAALIADLLDQACLQAIDPSGPPTSAHQGTLALASLRSHHGVQFALWGGRCIHKKRACGCGISIPVRPAPRPRTWPGVERCSRSGSVQSAVHICPRNLQVNTERMASPRVEEKMQLEHACMCRHSNRSTRPGCADIERPCRDGRPADDLPSLALPLFLSAVAALRRPPPPPPL